MKCWLLLLLPAVFLVQPNLAQQSPTDKGAAAPYFIVGDVKRPGIYKFEDRMRIFDAIAYSGGFRNPDAATEEEIVVVRDKHKIPFNWDEFRSGRNLDQNLALKAWDIIEVRHKAN